MSIVTAQNRAEDIQDAPIAINASNHEILERSAIEDICDYTGRAPGLFIDNTSAGPRAAVASIGGIELQIDL